MQGTCVTIYGESALLLSSNKMYIAVHIFTDLISESFDFAWQDRKVKWIWMQTYYRDV